MISKAVLDLAEKLGNALIQQDWKVSLAESCTGGGATYAITSIPGSSAWFDQSVVTYANSAKEQWLKVSPEIFIEHGAVSSPTVNAMLDGLSDLIQADVYGAISGIAGPGGGTEAKPVGTVFVGTRVQGENNVSLYHFSGNRESIREQAIVRIFRDLLDRLPQLSDQ